MLRIVTELEEGLAAVSRSVRAEFLDAREVEEEAAEHLARKEADLVDVILEAMHRGQRLRLRIGASQFAGLAVHVADDLMILDDDGGAQVDVRVSALDELWLSEPVRGAGRSRSRDVPGSFEDCIEGLEATNREVELGGPRLPPTRCRVYIAAGDHLVLDDSVAQHVIPRSAVGFVIRRR